MKKIKVLAMMLCIAAIGVTTSCSKDENNNGGNNNVQHLEKMSLFKNGECIKETIFTWDGGLLKNMYSRGVSGDNGDSYLDFKYEGSKLTSIVITSDGSWDRTWACDYHGDLLTGMTQLWEGDTIQYNIEYNNNGDISTVSHVGHDKVVYYTWQNGNIVKVEDVNTERTWTYEYTYDNRNSAYNGMSVAFFSDLKNCDEASMHMFLSKNNLLTEKTYYSDGTSRIGIASYTYDDNGYPLTMTAGDETYYFKYSGKTDPSPNY